MLYLKLLKVEGYLVFLPKLISQVRVSIHCTASDTMVARRVTQVD